MRVAEDEAEGDPSCRNAGGGSREVGMEAVKQNDKEAECHGAKETSRGRPKPRISEGSCSKEADLESVMGIRGGRQGGREGGRQI